MTIIDYQLLHNYQLHFLQMRIPTEHFTATPVFALSPTSNTAKICSSLQPNSMLNGQTMHYPQHQKPQQAQFASLSVTNCHKPIMTQSHQRQKKCSLPASLGLLGVNNLQSVGSAPTSPTLSRASSVESRSGDANQASFSPKTLPPNHPFNNEMLSATEFEGDEHHENNNRAVPTIFGTITGSAFATQSYYERSLNAGNPNDGVIMRRNKPAAKYATLPRK